jgi:hypothetical protein
MKIRNLFLVIGLLAAFCLPAIVVSGQTAAVDIFSHCGDNDPNYQPDVCSDVNSAKAQGDPIINIIKIAIDILSFIIGIAAVITVVVSGLRMIFSGGDSQAVASARGGLIYALAGLAIVALAQALVAFVLDRVK